MNKVKIKVLRGFIYNNKTQDIGKELEIDYDTYLTLKNRKSVILLEDRKEVFIKNKEVKSAENKDESIASIKSKRVVRKKT